MLLSNCCQWWLLLLPTFDWRSTVVAVVDDCCVCCCCDGCLTTDNCHRRRVRLTAEARLGCWSSDDGYADRGCCCCWWWSGLLDCSGPRRCMWSRTMDVDRCDCATSAYCVSCVNCEQNDAPPDLPESTWMPLLRVTAKETVLLIFFGDLVDFFNFNFFFLRGGFFRELSTCVCLCVVFCCTFFFLFIMEWKWFLFIYLYKGGLRKGHTQALAQCVRVLCDHFSLLLLFVFFSPFFYSLTKCFIVFINLYFVVVGGITIEAP